MFIAIDIEDPLLVSKIDKIKDAVISSGVPMKPVESYNYHITLRFIGEVPSFLVDEIKSEVLQKIKFKPFNLTFKGLGAFPGVYKPRVVWIGISEGIDHLRKIRDEIEKGLRRLGIPPEREKEFSPHLTIARIKGTRNLSSLVKIINEYSEEEFGKIEVKYIRLKKSTLTRSGPIYETLMEVKAS